MLPPESSPVHKLVSTWWNAEFAPRYYQVESMREQLWMTVVMELQAWTRAKLIYDPMSDARVVWASQYLNREINEDVTARAALFFDSPLLPCGKDRAVGS